MYARSVDDAGARLRELGRRGWESLGVGVVAFGLALGATQAYPPLAVPLFVGGLVLLASGVRAIWRHWDLLDWLTDERDAYVIPEVLARARRETTMERRRTFAADVRSVLTQAAGYRPRADVAEELEVLAAELDDPGLVLDPACAVACMRLLSDPGSSLFDPAACDAEVQRRIARIRAGFATRERGGTADARAADGEPLYV